MGGQKNFSVLRFEQGRVEICRIVVVVGNQARYPVRLVFRVRAFVSVLFTRTIPFHGVDVIVNQENIYTFCQTFPLIAFNDG